MKRYVDVSWTLWKGVWDKNIEKYNEAEWLHDIQVKLRNIEGQKGLRTEECRGRWQPWMAERPILNNSGR